MSIEHLFHSAWWKIMMIDISWIRWHIYNFVVCKYNYNKQSESESESDCRQRQMYRTKHKAGDSFLAQMEPHNGEEELDCGPKSSFQMRTSFVFHLETKVLESGGRVEKLRAQVAWSPVLSFHSLWWSGVQCHLLVLVHCVFWKPTSLHPFTKKYWSTSCFLLLTSFLKMLISFSSRIWHLPTLPKAPEDG